MKKKKFFKYFFANLGTLPIRCGVARAIERPVILNLRHQSPYKRHHPVTEKKLLPTPNKTEVKPSTFSLLFNRYVLNQEVIRQVGSTSYQLWHSYRPLCLVCLVHHLWTWTLPRIRDSCTHRLFAHVMGIATARHSLELKHTK
jgi:hypothetical protein